MTIFPPVSENRKTEYDIPPVVALVWEALLKLPEEPQLLLRALLTKGHDFEHPKRGHVLRDLAAHLGVTDRTVRNMVRQAIEHPILQRAALGALPEIEIERGKNARSFTSDTGRADHAGHSESKQSKADRGRRTWGWSERENQNCLAEGYWVMTPQRLAKEPPRAPTPAQKYPYQELGKAKRWARDGFLGPAIRVTGGNRVEGGGQGHTDMTDPAEMFRRFSVGKKVEAPVGNRHRLRTLSSSGRSRYCWVDTLLAGRLYTSPSGTLPASGVAVAGTVTLETAGRCSDARTAASLAVAIV
jgi:hypothetical protein